MRSPKLRDLGHGLAAAAVLAMVVQVVIAWVTDHPDAYDLWGYTLVIGVPTLGLAVLGWRGGTQAGWGYLVAVFGTALAAERGLTSYGVYAGVFLVAVVITQVVPAWRHDRIRRQRARPASGVEAFRAMDDRDLQQDRGAPRRDT